MVENLELLFVWHSSTSKAAAEAAKHHAEAWLWKVLQALREYGPMTDEEQQTLLKLNPSTQRPRRVDLVARGLVEDSQIKRLTRSGRKAVVWRALGP